MGSEKPFHPFGLLAEKRRMRAAGVGGGGGGVGWGGAGEKNYGAAGMKGKETERSTIEMRWLPQKLFITSSGLHHNGHLATQHLYS